MKDTDKKIKRREERFLKLLNDFNVNFIEEINEVNYINYDFKQLLTNDNWQKLRRISRENIELPLKPKIAIISKVILGYKFISDSWIEPKLLQELKKKELKKFNEKGYAEYNDLFFGSKEDYIYSKNIIFKTQSQIIKMIFDSGQDFLKIDEDLCERINASFSNLPTLNPRSFSANLESKEFLRKIGSREFVPKKINENIIFKKMIEILNQVNFKYLVKETLETLFFDLCETYNLIGDEWYYILKSYGINDFNFSKGNSMAICTKEFSFDLTIEERAKKLWGNNLKLLTLQELSLAIGVSQFATINFDFFREISGKILFFDDRNIHHINQLKTIFDPIIKNKIGQRISISQMKKELSYNSDKISLHFAHSRTFTPLLHIVYPETFKKIEGGLYLLQNTKGDNFIEIDDWSGF